MTTPGGAGESRHRDARAAIEVARARTTRAARALRRATRALAQAEAAVDPVDFQTLRSPADVDRLAALLASAVQDRGEVDVLVLVPHGRGIPSP